VDEKTGEETEEEEVIECYDCCLEEERIVGYFVFLRGNVFPNRFRL
jgi:hypothetical protein